MEANKKADEIEAKIKWRLVSRGFGNETLLNNRGLIGAVIEETLTELKSRL